MDPLCPLRQNVRRYRGIPSTRPALGTLFRSGEFGKRTGRGSARAPRGGCLLLAAIWQWWLTDFGHLDYALHDAIGRARRNARRAWFSNSFLQFFRQHSWHAPKMSLFVSADASPSMRLSSAIAPEKCEKPDQRMKMSKMIRRIIWVCCIPRSDPFGLGERERSIKDLSKALSGLARDVDPAEAEEYR